MERLFLFEEQFGSVPFHKQTQELALGTERFHFIPFGSRTEHTPKVQVFPHPYSHTHCYYILGLKGRIKRYTAALQKNIQEKGLFLYL
jgi:hypothetical protein